MTEPLPQKTEVAIIGAGAAGLLAAISAAEDGHKVTVFERLDKPGKKILATGGGRCNLTNLLPARDFLACYEQTTARFMTPALHHFSSSALIEFFNEHGLATFSPDNWRIYPKSQKAGDVVTCLLKVCNQLGVQIYCNTPVSEISHSNHRIQALTLNGSAIVCEMVIMTTGGQSMPELGSDGSGFNLLRRSGHSICPPVPGLSGLVINQDWVRSLAGLSLDDAELILKTTRMKKPFRVKDSILFTHKGISGPAALNLSGIIARELTDGETVDLQLRLKPGIQWKQQIADWRNNNGKAGVHNLLSRLIPKRLASSLLKLSDISEEQIISTLAGENQKTLCALLENINLRIKSTEGFNNSMVTSGGVLLKEVDRQTMQSRLFENLYFAGEILNVDGPCGGYNLQWAFSSGHLAGKLGRK